MFSLQWASSTELHQLLINDIKTSYKVKCFNNFNHWILDKVQAVHVHVRTKSLIYFDFGYYMCIGASLMVVQFSGNQLHVHMLYK